MYQELRTLNPNFGSAFWRCYIRGRKAGHSGGPRMRFATRLLGVLLSCLQQVARSAPGGASHPYYPGSEEPPLPYHQPDNHAEPPAAFCYIYTNNTLGPRILLGLLYVKGDVVLHQKASETSTMCACDPHARSPGPAGQRGWERIRVRIQSTREELRAPQRLSAE